MKLKILLGFLISSALIVRRADAFQDIIQGVTEDAAQVFNGILGFLQRFPWMRPSNTPGATTTDHDNSAIIVEAAPERTVYLTETIESINQTIELNIWF